MVWIQIKTDILSDLICAQTIKEGYQQMTKISDSRQIDNPESKGKRFGIWDQTVYKMLSADD